MTRRKPSSTRRKRGLNKCRTASGAKDTAIPSTIPTEVLIFSATMRSRRQYCKLEGCSLVAQAALPPLFLSEMLSWAST